MDTRAVTRQQLGDLSPVVNPERLPTPDRRWTDAEWAVVARGRDAATFDEKWQFFTEDQRVFIHRSWTGDGVYEAQFARRDGMWEITELLVRADRRASGMFGYGQSPNRDAWEAAFVVVLIDGWLLDSPDPLAWERLKAWPTT